MVLSRKALFLDRDGILNKDTAYPYLPEHIQFNDPVFDLCKKAIDAGYLILVMTNQAGVAKGKFSKHQVINLHEWMQGEFGKRGIVITRFYFCPHHINGLIQEYRLDCNCRKPKPGMFLEAVKDFSVDLSRSLMVGDKESDRIQLPGLRSIIVKSDYTSDGYDIENLVDVMPFIVK